MERIILAAILIAALTAAGIMLRRSFRRAATGAGPCAGCPMAGSCDESHAQADRQAEDARRDEEVSP